MQIQRTDVYTECQQNAKEESRCPPPAVYSIVAAERRDTGAALCRSRYLIEMSMLRSTVYIDELY